MVKSLSFGLLMPVFKDWIPVIQTAEALGFDFIWLRADHRYTESFAALTYALSQTKRVKMGPIANSVFLRHPVLMASGTALIDQFASDRIVAGYSSAGYETSVRLHIPDTDSVQACREAIEITRALWKGTVVNYAGTHWQLSNVQLAHPARNTIPIYLATRGGKFKLAGELADGVFTHGKSAGYLQRMLRDLAAGAKIANRDPTKIDRAAVIPFRFSSSDQITEKKEELKGLLGSFAGCEYSLDWVGSLGLSIDEVQPLRQLIRDRQPKERIAEAVDRDLRDKLIDAFAVVGTPEDCLTEVEAMHKNGVTQIVPTINSTVYPTTEAIRGFLKNFQEQIITPMREMG